MVGASYFRVGYRWRRLKTSLDEKWKRIGIEEWKERCKRDEEPNQGLEEEEEEEEEE